MEKRVQSLYAEHIVGIIGELNESFTITDELRRWDATDNAQYANPNDNSTVTTIERNAYTQYCIYYTLHDTHVQTQHIHAHTE